MGHSGCYFLVTVINHNCNRYIIENTAKGKEKVWYQLSVTFSLSSTCKNAAVIYPPQTGFTAWHMVNFRGCCLVIEVHSGTETLFVEPCPWHWQAAAGSLTRRTDDSDSRPPHNTKTACVCVVMNNQTFTEVLWPIQWSLRMSGTLTILSKCLSVSQELQARLRISLS